MRGSNQQRGPKDNNEFGKANSERTPQTISNESSLVEASSKSDSLFEFESNPSESYSARNALFSSRSLGNKSWTPEALPIGRISLEETLEEELTSGVLENSSLSYIRSKADKLESAIREVNRECDNLIAVCDQDDDIAAILPSDKTLPELGKNSSATTSKRMLVMASIALFATCGGVYAYVNPQNPINLAVHSRIAEFTNRSVTQTIIKPSKNVYASLGGFPASPQRHPVQIEKTAKPSPEPIRPAAVNGELPMDTATPDAQLSNLAETNIADAPIVREIIPLPLHSDTPAPLPANPSEPVSLSERFGKGETSQAVQQDVMPSKKRDIEMVKRFVLQANAGATLDNSQFNILVARLAQGDCLSSALHGIFGGDKISPIFVRTLLTDMTNSC